MSGTVVNIAGYRFADLPDRNNLQQPFRKICQKLHLKGTILLAHEGINFFLAGSQTEIDLFIAFLEEDERFQDIPLKVSYSDYQPFRRMNVRLKKEIISLGMNHIKPAEFTGEEISPTDFKQLLDAGEEVVILDTRNEYECKIGTFQNALELDIRSFRDFPSAVDELDEQLKDKPVVMFCTGGIRCEKASVVMLDAGFSNVKQLKGGILGYFEEVGGDYWNGDCFVFDRRVAVNPQLEETDVVQCYACREPLLLEEQDSDDYVVAQSCPYCAGKK
ncbi:MAG: sulfurtransferase [Candidatus Thermoplasmatota archaeon]|nr:sulfurtransferase [Candidatus Thermoplasmatota archaeon]MEC8352971.1 sulfurtransferase [Candidatus Thermoplasmatota archaeon]